MKPIKKTFTILKIDNKYTVYYQLFGSVEMAEFSNWEEVLKYLEDKG